MTLTTTFNKLQKADELDRVFEVAVSRIQRRTPRKQVLNDGVLINVTGWSEKEIAEIIERYSDVGL